MEPRNFQEFYYDKMNAQERSVFVTENESRYLYKFTVKFSDTGRKVETPE